MGRTFNQYQRFIYCYVDECPSHDRCPLFLENPSVAGWVTPDKTFKQIQQEDARKRAERREAIKNAWINKQVTFYKFIPSDATLRLTGIYMIVTAMLDYWFIGPERIYRAICQGVVGVFFTASKTFFSKEMPTWCISLGWLVGLTIYLPLNLLRHWWYAIDPIFSASLSLAHSAIILCVLPLHLGIAVVTITLVLASYAIATRFLFTELSWLFPLFLTTLFLFFIIIYLKVNIYILNKKANF